MDLMSTEEYVIIDGEKILIEDLGEEEMMEDSEALKEMSHLGFALRNAFQRIKKTARELGIESDNSKKEEQQLDLLRKIEETHDIEEKIDKVLDRTELFTEYLEENYDNEDGMVEIDSRASIWGVMEILDDYHDKYIGENKKPLGDVNQEWLDLVCYGAEAGEALASIIMDCPASRNRKQEEILLAKVLKESLTKEQKSN